MGFSKKSFDEIGHGAMGFAKKSDEDTRAMTRPLNDLELGILRYLQQVNKRNFDEIGHGQMGFVKKRGFDEIGHGQMGFAKRDFDEIGHGQMGFAKRNFDEIGHGMMGFAKRNFDEIGHGNMGFLRKRSIKQQKPSNPFWKILYFQHPVRHFRPLLNTEKNSLTCSR